MPPKARPPSLSNKPPRRNGSTPVPACLVGLLKVCQEATPPEFHFDKNTYIGRCVQFVHPEAEYTEVNTIATGIVTGVYYKDGPNPFKDKHGKKEETYHVHIIDVNLNFPHADLGRCEIDASSKKCICTEISAGALLDIAKQRKFLGSVLSLPLDEQIILEKLIDKPQYNPRRNALMKAAKLRNPKKRALSDMAKTSKAQPKKKKPNARLTETGGAGKDSKQEGESLQGGQDDEDDDVAGKCLTPTYQLPLFSFLAALTSNIHFILFSIYLHISIYLRFHHINHIPPISIYFQIPFTFVSSSSSIYPQFPFTFISYFRSFTLNFHLSSIPR